MKSKDRQPHSRLESDGTLYQFLSSSLNSPSRLSPRMAARRQEPILDARGRSISGRQRGATELQKPKSSKSQIILGQARPLCKSSSEPFLSSWEYTSPQSDAIQGNKRLIVSDQTLPINRLLEPASDASYDESEEELSDREPSLATDDLSPGPTLDFCAVPQTTESAFTYMAKLDSFLQSEVTIQKSSDNQVQVQAGTPRGLLTALMTGFVGRIKHSTLN